MRQQRDILKKGIFLVNSSFSILQLHGEGKGEDGKRRWVFLEFTSEDNNYVFTWASSENIDGQQTISMEYFKEKVKS